MMQLPGRRLREPIARSWHRSALAGLNPTTALRALRPTEVDPQSRLLTAAQPVLEELNDRLDGNGIYTILVDHDGRIIRCCGDRTIAVHSEAVGIRLGASLSEDTIGTNGPGTALAVRSGIVVNGIEHFAESLRRFSCYGQPIFHPATRRLLGALDISVLAPEANPLLAPLIAKAVTEIEQRLLEGSRVSERILLAAFQAVARRARPVVAIADDLLLSNQGAVDLLEGADIARLRNLAADLAGTAELDLDLQCGQRARVRVERVAGARGGVLVHIHPTIPPAAPGLPRRVPGAVTGHIHVAGPRGSGRSSEACVHAPSQPWTVLTGRQAVLDGAAAWAERFNSAVRVGAGSICVDGVDMLPAELVDLVAAHAASSQPPHLVLTSGPRETLSEPIRALAALCTETIDMLPLGHRLSELPAIAARMLAEVGAGQSHHLTPGALRVLSSYDWPGNLTELQAVLTRAIGQRSSGPIGPDDLPPALTADAVHRNLAPIERAERNAIIAALRTAAGNKVKAARSLGISRTTLYARMRSLHVKT